VITLNMLIDASLKDYEVREFHGGRMSILLQITSPATRFETRFMSGQRASIEMLVALSKNPCAVAQGGLGRLKGGRARDVRLALNLLLG
jgi:hypothetical protein